MSWDDILRVLCMALTDRDRHGRRDLRRRLRGRSQHTASASLPVVYLWIPVLGNICAVILRFCRKFSEETSKARQGGLNHPASE